MAELVCCFKHRTMSSRTLWEIGRSPLDWVRKCHKTKISEFGHDEESLYAQSNKSSLCLNASWVEGEALCNVTEWDVSSRERAERWADEDCQIRIKWGNLRQKGCWRSSGLSRSLTASDCQESAQLNTFLFGFLNLPQNGFTWGQLFSISSNL